MSLAAAGDRAAFEELYRRHAPLARRVARSVLRDDRDVDDVVADAFERLLRVIPTDRLHDRKAFRAYLLVTTRHLALDAGRRRGRSGALPDDAEDAADLATPLEAVVGNEEAVLVRRAFGALPERWRSVLWLTEVEGLPHKAAGELLGVSANGVAQLALRARAGLRESFLQASVAGPSPEPCRFTRERLAAHAGGALPAAEAAEVERHLESCDGCRARFAEVTDLAGTLRHAGIPIALVLGLGGGILRPHVPGQGVGPWSLVAHHRRLLGGAVAAAAAVVVGLVLVHDPPPDVRVPAVAPATAATTVAPAPVTTLATVETSTTAAPTTTTTSTSTTTPAPVAAAARPARTTSTTLAVRVAAPAVVDDDDDDDRDGRRRGRLPGWCRRPGKAHDDEDPDRRRC